MPAQDGGVLFDGVVSAETSLVLTFPGITRQLTNWKPIPVLCFLTVAVPTSVVVIKMVKLANTIATSGRSVAVIVRPSRMQQLKVPFAGKAVRAG